MKGLVRLSVSNLGTEVWLVDNADDVQNVFDMTHENGADSPLDAASRIAQGLVVLRAHWGNDIPSEPDMVWLNSLLAETGTDANEVRDLVETWWET